FIIIRREINVKRKNIFFISILAMLMLVATACGDSSNEAGSNGEEEDITVEFWTMQLEQTFTDYLEDLIDRNEEENPNVTIDRKSTRLNSSHVSISYAV